LLYILVVMGKPTIETENERRKSKSQQNGRMVKNREVNNSPRMFRTNNSLTPLRFNTDYDVYIC